MAVTYGFYNSLNGDRKYNAEQMSQIFDGIINDGVFGTVGSRFTVSPSSGMVISVAAGRAWFNHTWTYNDAPITLTVGTAPTGSLKRIDAVIIEVNTNTRINTIKIITGTAAASPSRPSLIYSGGVYQYAIAYITVNAGTTTISGSMIEGVVGTDTPLVTGPLETITATQLYDYWRVEFEEWFDHLQDELDENQAANLQHQIDIISSTLNTTIASIPTASSNNPLMDGAVSVGSSSQWARGDHRHPIDTSRAAASHTHAAGDISSGTINAARLPTTTVAKGGTGKTSVTANSFIVGNGTNAMVEKTAAQVLSLIGAQKDIVFGSYVGTGTYGSDNPNSITFSTAPEFIWLFATRSPTASQKNATKLALLMDSDPGMIFIPMTELTTSYVQYRGFSTKSYTIYSYAKKSSDGKTVYWYNTYGDSCQRNFYNTTLNAADVYYYLAI